MRTPLIAYDQTNQRQERRRTRSGDLEGLPSRDQASNGLTVQGHVSLPQQRLPCPKSCFVLLYSSMRS